MGRGLIGRWGCRRQKSRDRNGTQLKESEKEMGQSSTGSVVESGFALTMLPVMIATVLEPCTDCQIEVKMRQGLTRIIAKYGHREGETACMDC
jgi:hypothetical protein